MIEVPIHDTPEEYAAWLRTLTHEELNELAFQPVPFEPRYNKAPIFLTEIERRGVAITKYMSQEEAEEAMRVLREKSS